MGSWQGRLLYKEDGTIPTFETKEEAEHYLQSMEPDTSGHDVQKSVEEPAIEKPVKQPAPKIDKSNAVNFHITDDALGAGSAKEKFRRNIEAIRTWKGGEREPYRHTVGTADFITVCWLGRACRCL